MSRAPSHALWLELQSRLFDDDPESGRRALGASSAEDAHGHFTRGGMELRIDSTFPPVRRPKVVPRS
jgi:hypothetical protein